MEILNSLIERAIELKEPGKVVVIETDNKILISGMTGEEILLREFEKEKPKRLCKEIEEIKGLSVEEIYLTIGETVTKDKWKESEQELLFAENGIIFVNYEENEFSIECYPAVFANIEAFSVL